MLGEVAVIPSRTLYWLRSITILSTPYGIRNCDPQLPVLWVLKETIPSAAIESVVLYSHVWTTAITHVSPHPLPTEGHSCSGRKSRFLHWPSGLHTLLLRHLILFFPKDCPACRLRQWPPHLRQRRALPRVWSWWGGQLLISTSTLG